MFGFNLDKGIFWNVKNNKVYNIKIKDKNDFVNKVVIVIFKGNFKIDNKRINYEVLWIKKYNEEVEYDYFMVECNNVVVIDVEINFFNEVVLIGVVIVDKNNFKLVD